jgi:hypothetical protein
LPIGHRLAFGDFGDDCVDSFRKVLRFLALHDALL